jgi:hypothetical protein
MSARPLLHRRLTIVLCIVLAAVLPVSVTAAEDEALTTAQRQTLEEYASDTWASFVAMTDPDTGLPADSLAADGTRSVQTSTTNIGAYLWSTVVAEALGTIAHGDAVARVQQTLTTLESMERHEPSGQFYNWYDHTTGAKLTVWPSSGDPLTPILCQRHPSRPPPCSTAWTSGSITGPM